MLSVTVVVVVGVRAGGFFISLSIYTLKCLRIYLCIFPHYFSCGVCQVFL